jgi:hypothetical protein
MNRPELILAFDWDGTIVKNRWPEHGPFRKGALRWMRWARIRKHVFILYTNREGDLLNVGAAKSNKMFEYGICFDLINENDCRTVQKYGGDCRKISADWYFDDKAGFIGWWTVPIIVLWLEWKYRKGGNLLA